MSQRKVYKQQVPPALFAASTSPLDMYSSTRFNVLLLGEPSTSKSFALHSLLDLDPLLHDTQGMADVILDLLRDEVHGGTTCGGAGG